MGRADRPQACRRRQDGDAGTGDRLAERLVQHESANPTARPPREVGRDMSTARDVGDAVERVSLRLDAQSRKVVESGRHESFTAGLVDRARAGLGDRDRQPCLGRLERRDEADRAASHHEQVDVEAHGRPVAVARRRARSSSWSRTASMGMLSTVNTSAVIQALWTRGRARPSTTTAT